MARFTEYDKQAQDFCEKNNVFIKKSFAEEGVKFPNEREDKNDVLAPRGHRHDMYRIIISRNGKRISLKFYQSISESRGNDHCNYKKPSDYSILACLQKSDPGSFEDFCADYGFNEDSIKDRKLWKKVIKEWEKVKYIFGDCLEELEEIC